MSVKVAKRTVPKSFRMETSTAEKLRVLSVVYKVPQSQLVTDLIDNLYADCCLGEKMKGNYTPFFYGDFLLKMKYRMKR